MLAPAGVKTYRLLIIYSPSAYAIWGVSTGDSSSDDECYLACADALRVAVVAAAVQLGADARVSAVVNKPNENTAANNSKQQYKTYGVEHKV